MNKIKKILFFLIAIEVCYAGTVTDLIDYREYRDFAENRGKYKVGNTNIEITRKDGVTKIITVPMPDFSSTDSNAIGTLIDPSYIVGVKHNTVMTSVRYGYAGGHEYKFIDRNDSPVPEVDRHIPRLNKLVTDVAPTILGPGSIDYKNTYEIYMRVGSGHQYVVDNETGKIEDLAIAYTYLTGGIINKDSLSNELTTVDRGEKFPSSIDKNILPIYLNPGDSGSPLWGYNKNTNQWELIAFGKAGSATTSYYISVDPEFYKNEIEKDIMPDVKNDNKTEEIIWKGISNKQGTGIIQQGSKEWKYDGLKSGSLLSSASNEELNFTKHISFSGVGGTIKLEDNINMGAGKLTFKNSYTMEGITDDISWVGAGIDISKDATVTWKVKGQKGDNLHKIGEGTLLVQGKGVNEGGLNVGNGTVILDQQAESNGKKQAFSNIDIVGGKATVVLNDSEQIATDKIRFMFRGGKLDVNGNNLKFEKIVAYDDGAQIINNSEKKAVLDIDVSNVNRPTLYKGHFGEKNKEKANKIDLNIYGNSTYPEYEDKSIGISGGINIDGDINFSSKGLSLVFQGVRDLHADEDPSESPGKGEYYMSKFKFNNLYIRDKVEGEFYPHGFIGGIYSNIEGNIIIEDSTSAVLGYVDDKWVINTEYGSYEYDKTLLVYDSNDKKSMDDKVSKIEINDSNISDEIKNGTTIYKGNVRITEKGTLDVGATYFTGGIEALNGGKISISNSQINAKLNIGEKVASLVKNTVGKLTDSVIHNNFEVKEKSQLIFDNLTTGNMAKLNVENSVVQIDNSKSVEGDILVSGEGALIGNQSVFNKVVSKKGILNLKDIKINKGLELTEKSEALVIKGNVKETDIKNNSIMQGIDVMAEKIFLDSKGILDFTGGKIKSLKAKESMTILDKTTVDNIDLTSSSDEKSILISKNNNINNLVSDNAYINLNNVNITDKIDSKNKSEIVVEDGKIADAYLSNNSTLKTLSTIVEKINIDNSKIESDTSIFNQEIIAKNNSDLNLNNSDILGKIDLENGSLKTNQTSILNGLNAKNSKGELNNTTLSGNIILDNSDIQLNNVTYGSTASLKKLSNISGNENIILCNNSYLNGNGVNLSGNIKFVESDIKLNNSNFIGALNGNGKTELKNTSWYIENDSNIDELLVESGDIKFIYKKENGFNKLTLDNISGTSKLTFNANLETGESDKLVIENGILNSFKTEIGIDNVGKDVELSKDITVVVGKKDTIDRIEVTNKTIDLGLVNGKVEIKNDGSLGLKPSNSEKPIDPDGSINIETPSYISKETAGSTTTTMLSEYAARIESIKSQNNLLKSEIDFSEDEGFNYIGNAQYGRYESSKFREYSQTIVNNGLIYKSNNIIDNNWTLSKGIGFIYGESNVDYDGDYTGNIYNYGIFGYLQFINQNGYYIAQNIGLGYNKNKINSEKFNTKSQNVGIKLGYEKGIDKDLKITLETGIDLYHISKSNYNLDFKNLNYNGNMTDKYFVEIKPEIKLSKNMELKNNKTSLYTGLELEYNNYMFGGKPIVNIVGDKHKVETAMIDKGATIKMGIENSYKNIDVTLEAGYFTGKNSNKKLKGNFKIKYKF